MSWNYRIIKKKWAEDYTEFAVHEVYYDDDGKPTAVTETSVYPIGETEEELHRDFKNYSRAFTEPVLNYEDISNEENV